MRHELKRVLLSRTCIFVLVALLLFDTAFLFSDVSFSIPGRLSDFANKYVELVEDYRVVSKSDALAALEDAQRELGTTIAYFSMFPDSESKSNEQLVEFFKSVYGEQSFDELSQWESEPSLDEISQLTGKLKAYELVCEQIRYVYDEYPAYYTQILQNAKRMEVLSHIIITDSFSERNVKKTVEDFGKIENLEISLDRELALTTFFESKLPHYSILVFIAAVSFELVSERRKGLWELVRSTKKGRMQLALWRIITMLAAAALAVLVLLVGQLLICCACFGGAGELSRPIQSLSLFKNVPDAQSVAAYLIKYFVYKVFGTWLVGLCVWLILQLVSDIKPAIIALVCFVSVQYATFTLIPDSFSIVVLRYINIFSYIDFERIFINYLNVPLFGIPVRGSHLCYALLPVLLLSIGALCVFVGERKYPSRPSFAAIDRLRARLSRVYDRLPIHRSLFLGEMNKVLVLRFGVLVLVALAAWSIFIAEAPARTTQSGGLEAYYRASLEGPIDDELFAKIDSELASIEAIAEPSEYDLNRLAAYSKIRSLAQQLLEEAGDKTPWIIDYSLYSALFDSDNTEASFITVLLCVLLCGGIFSYENSSQTKQLVRCTKKGRLRLFFTKLAVGLALSAVVGVLVYSVELARATEEFGEIRSLAAPISSLPLGIGLDGDISIGAWLCGAYLTRLLVLVALCAFCMMISSLCESSNHTLAICIGVAVLPYALSFLRIELLEKLSVVSLLASVAYSSYITVAALALLVALLSTLLSCIVWCYDRAALYELGEMGICTLKNVSKKAIRYFRRVRGLFARR